MFNRPSSAPDSRTRNAGFYFCILIIVAAFLPWLIFIWRISLNGDSLWLLEAASRLLRGQVMAQSYYDNNPPLSVLIYSPAALMVSWGLLAPHNALQLYMLLLIAASLVSVWRLLEKLDGLTSAQRFALLLGYAASVTILPSISYSERDHILLLGLFPLALLQLVRTWQIPVSKGLVAGVTVCGTIAILLKPHYLVILLILQVYRAVAQRRLSAVFDLESWIVVGVTALYTAVIFLFFSDYLHIILPDVVALYVGNFNSAVAAEQAFEYGAIILTYIGVEAYLSPLRGQQRQILLAFYGLSFICLLIFTVQMKGYYYQIIPTLGFFFAALSLSAESYARQYTRIETHRATLVIFLLALVALAYGARPLLLTYPTATDYKNLPLTVAIRRLCDAPSCSAFIFNDSIEIVPQTYTYGSFKSASRFSEFWFLHPIENISNQLTQSDRNALRKKYAGMVTEDFVRYHPDVIATLQGLYFRPGEKFDFVTYFSQLPAFRAEMKNYEPAGSISFDRARYFSGTALAHKDIVTFNLYKRRGQ